MLCNLGALIMKNVKEMQQFLNSKGFHLPKSFKLKLIEKNDIVRVFGLNLVELFHSSNYTKYNPHTILKTRSSSPFDLWEMPTWAKQASFKYTSEMMVSDKVIHTNLPSFTITAKGHPKHQLCSRHKIFCRVEDRRNNVAGFLLISEIRFFGETRLRKIG